MRATRARPLTGRTEPRLWTPPLRKLTRATSHGFEVVDFAAGLGVELMPWQKWVLKHGLERRGGGGYRFRTVVVLVARQSGKTTIAKVLSLWRMMQDAQTVLGTSTNLEYARDAFEVTAALAEDMLPGEVAKVKRGALDTSMTLVNRSRYRVAAANRRGGRSLSVDQVILDELREHATWDAWGAASATTIARPDPQVWCFSNAGDDSSIVLNHQRELALGFIDTGEGDDSLALFEWSAPDGCDLDDPQAWAQANPALGFTVTEAALVSKLASAPPAVFRTEHLTQRVAAMDTAVDLRAWQEGADEGTLEGLRDRVALCLDVSLDLAHVSLVAAAVGPDARVRVEVVAAWESVNTARSELPGWLEKVKPRALGWYPKGPGAALATDLRGLRNAEAFKGEDISAICLGLTEQVAARRVLHSGDPLLTAQLGGTSKLWSGDGWRFARKGAGHCDCVYAAAGAIHLARTLPPAPSPLVVL
jgi:hypothetical protein